MFRASVLLLAIAGTGCAHARLVGPSTLSPPDPGVQRTVVIEPFFEQSDWEVVLKTEHATVYNPYSTFGPTDVAITRQVAEKPLYARVPSLNQEQQLVIAEVQRLRPTWHVTSTGALTALSGPISLVRTVVGRVDVFETNRTLKNLACGFGFVLPPLWLLLISPVHETQRITGSVVRYETDAETAKARVLKYPTQPDFAVDTRGLETLSHPVGLDVEFEEGFFASDSQREPVLLEGFAQKVAAAVVAIVEEGR